MSLGVKLRFEVLKRDGYTCQYCGRQTPNVVLEVDHVIPRCEGGTDEMMNLVTSCWECNRGKGGRLLDNRAPVIDTHDQTILMLERELQLAEYNTVKKTMRERIEREVEELSEYWRTVSRVRKDYVCKKTLRVYLASIPIEDIKDMMDYAVLRCGENPAALFFYKIAWTERRRRTGITSKAESDQVVINEE